MLLPGGNGVCARPERRRNLSNDVCGHAVVGDGFAPVEVARQIGVDRRSARRWKAAARKGGTPAVAAKPASGRPRRLVTRDLTRLRMLVKGAQAAGCPPICGRARGSVG